MNKKFLAYLIGVGLSITLLAVICCLIATLYLCNKANNGVINMQKDVTTLSNHYIEETNAEEEPQYVTIANHYQIIDTSPISDAYLSGDASSLSEEDQETLQLASDVLKEITTDSMSLYEKEVAVHDWMIKNISYDNNNLASIPAPSNSSHTPYGVLKYHKSICVGYATTFKLFMNMLGADCMIEHDSDLTHSWDLVKLDDNQWYLVDITFDDTNDTDPDAISYTNFNLTNDQFASTHTWDYDLYPTANGTTYSYAAQNAVEVNDVKKLPSLIKKAADKKTTNLFYLLPKTVDDTYMTALITGIQDRFYNIGCFDSYYIYTADNRVVLCISLSYSSESSSGEENYPELTEELNSLFGSSMDE